MTEMDSIDLYEVFKNDDNKTHFDTQNKVINAPKGHHKINLHHIFAVKYDGKHKARLVADGHI